MSKVHDAEAYPLYWPEGRPRWSGSRRYSKFKTGFGAAVKEIVAELRALKVPGTFVISSNVELRNDGLPRANMEPADPGVAVYFTYKGHNLALCCDKWNLVRDNMHALSMTLAAIRGIERWGTGEMVEAAFLGFRALPPVAKKKPWREVLGVVGWTNATLTDIELVFRARAREAHPDKGGDADVMAELNRAMEEARVELGR